MARDPRSDHRTDHIRTPRAGSIGSYIPRLDIHESDTVNGRLVGNRHLGVPTRSPVVRPASTQPAVAPPIKSVSSLQALLPRTRWLWNPWLPRGYLTLLAGAPGVGKSALALRVTQSVIESDNWPDGSNLPDEQIPPYVCWADTEASQALLVSRCEQWSLSTGRILIPSPDDSPLTDLRLNDQASWDALVQVITLYKTPLVVLDSLRGSYRGDENSSDLVELLSKLASLARDKDCAILVLHHLRKANNFESMSEVTLDRIRGTSAIPAMCRVIWALDAPNTEKPDHMRLSVIKSNLGLKPDPLGMVWEDGNLQFCEAPTKPQQESQLGRAADILRAFLQGNPRRAVDVFSELQQAGISGATVNRAKARLGIVATKHKDGWWWSLPARDVDPAE